MRSLKFPKMFQTNSTNVWKANEHKQATLQNCETLLHIERGELLGDPYFGLLLRHYLFDQKNVILQDAIIDIIYTQLSLFIPQIKVNRNDIKIIDDDEKGELICQFYGIDQIDFTNNMYQLLLFKTSDAV